LGLEQGFTLTEAPSRPSNQGKAEPLTITLAVGGDLSASADSSAGGRDRARAQGITLSDGNGQAVLRYAGLAAYDAKGKQLPAWLELDRGELRLRVKDANAHYPVVVDPFVQRAKLVASDGATNHGLGLSVAISSDGTTIVAGALGATIGTNVLEGAAYVFVEPATGWANATQIAKLTASDGALGDLFAGSVGMSGDGNTIVAGSGATIGSNVGQGAAYVFVKPPTGWATATETAKLTAADGQAHDVFGRTVAISSDGSTIVAGAVGAAIGSNQEQGAAYVFLKPASGWLTGTAAAKLTASDGVAFSELGDSVALSSDGSTIVAGSPAFFSQEAAYVFVKPASGWLSETQTAKLTASDGVIGDIFGIDAGISGDGSTIVVGADQAKIGSNFHQGAAYVFVEPANGWASETESAKLTASDGAPSDKLGAFTGISADGSTIAAGAVRATIGSNAIQGAAYVFLKPSTGWTSGTESAKLVATDGTAGDAFGSSFAFTPDGSTIVVGAFGATIGSNSGQGAAYVFVPAPFASPSPTSLSFGNQAVGTTSSAQTVTLKNTGNAPLHVTAVAAASGFSTTTNCVTASPLAVGATCTESVSFIPTTIGAIAGGLTFTDDSNGVAGSSQTVSLNGTGVMATTATSIISAVTNPSVVGQPVAVNFLVSPQAGDILAPSGTVTVTASTGESCSASAPSGSCALTFVTAVPRTITASYGGDANFVGSISAGVAQTVQDFNLGAGPASETISPGQKATYNLTLAAVDGLSGNVALSCSGGPSNSSCIFSPNPVTLSGPATGTLSLSGSKKMSHGTFTVILTGTFGSGNPATGGLTRTGSVSLTVK
jgi:hypothetical protein